MAEYPTSRKTRAREEVEYDFEKEVTAVFDELKTLLLTKHRDYGPKNISDSPGGAMNGLLVRLHDKMARLKHLLYVNKTQAPMHESIEDTFKDMANYAVIALLVRRGKWDK